MSHKQVSSGVDALVSSVKQHRKFRQLASYSVQCLSKAITPPNPGWENNVKMAVETGALEAITEVLKLHSGNEEVFEAATGCLASIAGIPKYAASLVETGALNGLLASLIRNPDQNVGVPQVLKLLENISITSPESLLQVGGVDAATKLIQSAHHRPEIVATSIRALERMNKVPGGSEAIVASDSVNAIVGFFEKRPEPQSSAALSGSGCALDVEILDVSFRLLERMARDKNHADYIRNECHGLERISYALEGTTDTRVARNGGRLLTVLAAGNVADVVQRMTSTEEPKDRDFLSGLIANLALEEENAIQIVEAGGVKSILTGVASSSQKTVEQSARALTRLILLPELAQEFIQYGGLETVKVAITAKNVTPNTIAAISSVLTKICASGDMIEKVMASGIFESMITAMRDNMDCEALAVETMAIVEHLCTSGYDLDSLVKMNVIETIANVYPRFPNNADIQLNGTRSLIYLSYNVENVSKMIRSRTLLHLVNYIQQIDQSLPDDTSLSNFKTPDTVTTAMQLLTQIVICPGGKEAIGERGVSNLLTSIARFGQDEKARNTVDELLAAIVTWEEVQKVLKNLPVVADTAFHSRSRQDVLTLRAMMSTICSYAYAADYASLMVRDDTVAIISRLIEKASVMNTLPDLDILLEAATRALIGFETAAEEDPDMLMRIISSGSISSVISALRSNPRLKRQVTVGVTFLDNIASTYEGAEAIIAMGGIEACVAALRANADNVGISETILNTFLQLSATDKGALAIARHGGTRQITMAMLANRDNTNFQSFMSKALLLQQRVSTSTEGAEILIKQGAVDSVVSAVDLLSKNAAGVGDTSYLSAFTRIMGRLLTMEDVQKTLVQLSDVSQAMSRGANPPSEIKALLLKFGYMSHVESFVDTIVSEGGSDSLVTIIRAVLSKDDTKEGVREMKADILPEAFKAFSSISKHPSADTKGFAPFLSEALDRNIAVPECLVCISNIAVKEEGAVEILADERLLGLTLNALRDNPRSKVHTIGVFNAISSLASYDSSLPILLQSPVLRVIQNWIDDYCDDETNAEALEVALTTVAKLSKLKPLATSMMETGISELILTVLSKACINSSKPMPAVFANSIEILTNLGRSIPEFVSNFSHTGGMKRIARAVRLHPQLMTASAPASKLFHFFSIAAADEIVLTELKTIGAQEIVVEGMNANGTNDSVIRAAAGALQVFGTSDLCVQYLDDLKVSVAELMVNRSMSHEPTVQLLTSLADKVQKLGNVIVIEGAVHKDNVSNILTELLYSLSVFHESPNSQDDHIAATLQGIGRLIELQGSLVDAEKLSYAVKLIMDVLYSRSSSTVKQSAVLCLGQIGSFDEGFRTLCQHDAIHGLRDIVIRSHGDRLLQEIGSNAMRKITLQAVKSAEVYLVNHSNSGAILADITLANIDDSAMIEYVLANISQMKGGEQLILDMISVQDIPSEVVSEALRILNEYCSERNRVLCDPKRVRALVVALGKAVTLQATLTAQSEHRTKVQALRMTECTLALLQKTDFEKSEADEFIVGGTANLFQLLSANVNDPDAVDVILDIMKNVTSKATSAVIRNAVTSEDMALLITVIGENKSNPANIVLCMDIISNIARANGGYAKGFDTETLRYLIAQNDELGKVYPEIHSSFMNLKLSMPTQFDATLAADEAMTSAMDRLMHAINNVQNLQEVIAEDGSAYYVDTESNETTWEAPFEFSAFKQSFETVSELLGKASEKAITELDQPIIAAITSALSSHARSPAIALTAGECLAALSANAQNCINIAEAGGISGIIEAIIANPNNLALLRALLVILERISRRDVYKLPIVEANGVHIIVNIALGLHLGIDDIVLKAMATAANLASNCVPAVEAILEADGIDSIHKAILRYKKSPRLLEHSMCAFSNLMFQREDVKEYIGNLCNEFIVKIIKDFPKDAPLVKMTLRVLGNLSCLDDNVRPLVAEYSLVRAIVFCMRAFPKDEELQQISMEVIGNLASLVEVIDDQDDTQSIGMYILREAGCAQILNNMKTFSQNTIILRAALDALSSVSKDVEIAEMMIKKQNLIPIVFEVMTGNDWDVEVLTRAIVLIGILSFCKASIPLIVQLGGVETILSSMYHHYYNQELVLAGQMTLTSLSGYKEVHPSFINAEGVGTLLFVLENNYHNVAYASECMVTLTRLAAHETLSMKVAELGMHILMHTIDYYSRNPDFLVTVFRLLGNLAFVEDNLTAIVQHNGIQRVILAITTCPDSRPLMVRSIQTLDNIAMASRENATLVIDEGGKELIETIMQTYRDDIDIRRYGESALLSLEALENLTKSAAATARAARGANRRIEYEHVDPLGAHRTILSAGKVIWLWNKGYPKTVHFVVSPDFRTVVWQEVGTQKKLGAMDLRNIMTFTKGLNKGHKKAFGVSKVADEKLAFSMNGDRATVDFEANSEVELNDLLEALNKLLHIYRNEPHLL